MRNPSTAEVKWAQASHAGAGAGSGFARGRGLGLNSTQLADLEDDHPGLPRRLGLLVLRRRGLLAEQAQHASHAHVTVHLVIAPRDRLVIALQERHGVEASLTSGWGEGACD